MKTDPWIFEPKLICDIPESPSCKDFYSVSVAVIYVKQKPLLTGLKTSASDRLDLEASSLNTDLGT